MTRFIHVIAIIFFVGSLSGCTTNQIKKVVGKVTLDGQPADAVSLYFQPPPDNLNQGSFHAMSKEDGTFEYIHDVKGPRAVPGKYWATFSDGKMQRNMEEFTKIMADPKRAKEIPKPRFPMKYNDAKNGIEVDIGPGTTDVGELKISSKD